MDVDAIGEHVEKLKAVRIDDDDAVDEDDVLDDYDDDDDDEEEEPVTLGFVDRPKNQWSLQRQFFPSKAGGVPVLPPSHQISLSVCSCCCALLNEIKRAH